MDLETLCMGCMEFKKDGAAECSSCGFVEGTAPDSPLYLPPRTLLEGKYLIGRVLGQGGFGITYLAWDQNLNVKLAIKEYFPQDLASRAAGHSQVSAYSGSMGSQYEYGLDKFLQEARTLAQFEGHPNIVSVRDFFKANGTAYFVMSYVEGITLKEYLANMGGKLPVDQARGIIMPVLDALKEVHSVNVLHRDVSPDNIFINQKGQVILIDFGAARQAIGEKGRSLSIILKPGYAPEEQYRSKGVQGPWTDIYAVAATFYHLVTGHQPPEALERLVEDPLESPIGLGAALSEGQEQALLKALSVRAENRFQTVNEFQAALAGQEAAAGVTAPAPAAVPTPVAPVKKKAPGEGRKAPLGLIVGAAVVVVLGVAAYALWSGGILGGGTAAGIDDPPPVFEEQPQPAPGDPGEVPDVYFEEANIRGNTVGNIVNAGLAARQGDWVFFRSNEGGSIYRGSLAEGEPRIISADSAWFINVSGEWLYYSNRDDNNRLYALKTDGTSRTVLTEGGAWFPTLDEGWIYFLDESDDYRIYKIDTDGSGRTRLGDDSAWDINVTGGWVYYVNRSDDGRIYRVRVDAGGREALNDTASSNINVHEGSVYYVNDEDGMRLYRMNLDGSGSEQLNDIPTWFVNVAGDWIYYADGSDNYSLYKMRLDGSGSMKLSNEAVRFIVVIDDWVFYLDQDEEDTIYKIKTDGTGRRLVEAGF